MNDVEESIDELEAAGARVNAIGSDVEGNVVEVMIEPVTVEARELLEERYGTAIQIVEGRAESV